MILAIKPLKNNTSLFWGKVPTELDFVKSKNLPPNFTEFTKLVETAFSRKDICLKLKNYYFEFCILPKLFTNTIVGYVKKSSDKRGRPYPIITGNILNKKNIYHWENTYQPENKCFIKTKNQHTINNNIKLSAEVNDKKSKLRFKLNDSDNEIFEILKLCRKNIKNTPHSFYIFNNKLEIYYKKPTYLDIASIMKESEEAFEH